MQQGYRGGERTVHYVYERDSFVPLVHATRKQALQLPPTTDVNALMAGNDGKYDIALDPLWSGEFEQEAEPFSKDEIAFYQCDHLGTQQELTDHEGNVTWSAQYKAWGQAKVAISEAASKAGIRNPIRFQGQYLDEETGLHYNRYRYYDSHSARYLTPDPIRMAGGVNLYQYTPDPIHWTDPLGLSKASCPHLYRGISAKHPALEEAKLGIVRPANPNANISREQHAEGGVTGQSQYASWTPDKEIALQHANKDGAGGVLLSVPVGPPGANDTWTWGWTHINEWGECEMLQEGSRTGVSVSQGRCK